jgi:hypothetical protein
VTKLAPEGNALVYSTYLGGTGPDKGYAIAVDGAGSAYVTGMTQCANFPTQSAYQATYLGNTDVFVTKLTPEGNALVYSTYLGGSADDRGLGIAVDGSGSAYVTGQASSTNFPIQSPYRATIQSQEVFVTKLTPAGNALVYSTYLGGNGGDLAYGIAVDGSGSAYVTGSTYSNNFPIQSAYQTTYRGNIDAFVTRLAGFVSETVSTPSTPSGATVGTLGVSYSYSTGGASSDLGHAVQYYFDWGDGTNSGWLAAGVTNASHSWPSWVLAGTFIVKAMARCADDISVQSGWSGGLTVTVSVPETASTPNTPSGTTSVTTGVMYAYSTGGASSNLGHSVQYYFDWGDGTNSGWLTVGVTNASHSWASAGNYTVKAMARCATHTSVQSGWSGGLTVNVSVPETVSTPGTPSGTTSPTTGASYSYSTGGTSTNLGHSVEYYFDWGDGTNSGWLAVGETSASHSWASAGSYTVKAMARCATHTSMQSGWSGGLGVTVTPRAGPDFNADGKTDIVWRNYQTGDNQVWFMNGAAYNGPAALLPVPDLNWRLVATADFNGDGQPDLLWRHAVTGANVVWYMNGTSYAAQASLSPVADLNYHIVAVADFNGDGKPDLLWRHYGTGQNIVWYMNGADVTGVGYPPMVADVGWKIVGAADFNSDGKPDIVWRHAATGDNAVWYMNGVNYSGQASLIPVTDLNWKIAGVADYNNDGKPDLLWRDVTTGENIMWFMNGVNYSAPGYAPNRADLNWVPAGDFDTPSLCCQTSLTDFNGDGKPDLLWRKTTSGENLLWLLNVRAYGTEALLNTVADTNWRIGAIADFNADGNPDLLWRHYGTGQNIVWYMNGASITGVGYPPDVLDVGWKIVGAADFNADGKPDIVWRHGTSGQMLVWFMNGTAYTGQALIATVSDANWKVGAIADLNGDGKPDLLWRHYGTGQNIVWYMNGATITGMGYPQAEADTNWKIVGAADFNGDGKPDLVWRHATTGANAVWYLNGVSYLGYGALPEVADPNWIIAMGGE